MERATNKVRRFRWDSSSPIWTLPMSWLFWQRPVLQFDIPSGSSVKRYARIRLRINPKKSKDMDFDKSNRLVYIGSNADSENSHSEFFQMPDKRIVRTIKFLKIQSATQLKAIFTWNFRLIQITHVSSQSDIRFGQRMGFLIKISHSNHSKVRFTKNRPYLRSLRIQVFKKCHYPIVRCSK